MNILKENVSLSDFLKIDTGYTFDERKMYFLTHGSGQKSWRLHVYKYTLYIVAWYCFSNLKAST